MNLDSEGIYGVCVFSNYRTGSNDLLSRLHAAISAKTVRQVWLHYDLLDISTISIASDQDVTHINIPGLETNTWPLPHPLEIDRVESLRHMRDCGHFPVFKIQPARHIHYNNRDHVKKFIYDDPGMFKIVLNRADISNQLLSLFMAAATRIFHHDRSAPHPWYASINDRITFDINEALRFANETKLHYLWHHENARRCHAVCWYDCIESASFPKLGIYSGELATSNFSKMNHNHEELTERLFTNHKDLLKIARDTEDSLAVLRDSLRKKTV